jgi:sugar/nucleoside kinase (ribokinase family)
MAGQAPRVLVCGDIINDILAQTGEPVARGDDNQAVIRTRPGGSAANQAAWMASLGLDVVFAGRAGAKDAEFHRQELARFGVVAGSAALAGAPRAEAGGGHDQPAMPGEAADPATMAAELVRHYGAVALKLGPDGAVLATADTLPVHIPARATSVRDTTGAGDAFCAGFLVAWLTGAAPLAATSAGIDAAALAVSALGGRPA